MNFVEYPDRELLAIDLADKLASEIAADLHHEERVTLAVPGGTTPGPIFDALCAAKLDWERVNVVPTDERWVPGDHPRSNTRLLRERFLTGPAASARLLPMYIDADQPEDVMGALNDGIAGHLPINVLLLGMGTDMHTASLFPGGDKLAEALDAHAPPVMAMRADGAGEARVTLTASVLAGAVSKHIVITGAEKREALEKARHLKPLQAPIAAVLKGSVVHWAE